MDFLQYLQLMLGLPAEQMQQGGGIESLGLLPMPGSQGMMPSPMQGGMPGFGGQDPMMSDVAIQIPEQAPPMPQQFPPQMPMMGQAPQMPPMSQPQMSPQMGPQMYGVSQTQQQPQGQVQTPQIPQMNRDTMDMSQAGGVPKGYEGYSDLFTSPGMVGAGQQLAYQGNNANLAKQRMFRDDFNSNMRRV
jgi:hypothetical protein